jgi:hypothetical protein
MTTICCPLCDSIAYSDRVSNIIDSNTTKTAGFAMTMGVGHSPVSPSVFFSNSTTALAQRFSTPPVPGQANPKNLLGWTFLWGTIASLMIYSALAGGPNNAFSNPIVYAFILSLPFGFLIGFLLYFPTQAIIWAATSRQRFSWEKSNHKLRNSLYCYRDNVVYDNTVVGEPADFMTYVFYELPKNNFVVA